MGTHLERKTAIHGLLTIASSLLEWRRSVTGAVSERRRGGAGERTEFEDSFEDSAFGRRREVPWGRPKVRLADWHGTGTGCK